MLDFLKRKKQCCVKWSGCQAIPVCDPDEAMNSAYARRDIAEYCPVCGKRLLRWTAIKPTAIKSRIARLELSTSGVERERNNLLDEKQELLGEINELRQKLSEQEGLEVEIPRTKAV